MAPASFDNIISKFKTTTKQAADQMQKAAKIAKLKMDVMTLSGEKSRYYQTIGERAYGLYKQSHNLDGATLVERVTNEFTQIERLDARLAEIDNQIADLQALVQDVVVTDVSESKNQAEEGKEQND